MVNKNSLSEAITECHFLFKQETENALKILLNEVPGEKIVVLDPNSQDIIQRCFPFLMTQKQAHDITKLIYLNMATKMEQSKTLVFLVPSDPKIFKQICNQINMETDGNFRCSRKYVILVMNSLSNVCENMLEEFGCWGRFDLHEVPMNLLPIDTDVYSSEQFNYLPGLFLHSDMTPLRSQVRGILQLESQFGRPNQIVAIGANAHKFKNLRKILLEFDKEKNSGQKFELKNIDLDQNSESGASKSNKTYDKLIILDRSVDFITPLVTCNTLESIIDDTFKIKAGIAKFNKEIINADKDRLFSCNNHNVVFKACRDLHIVDAINEITSVYKRIDDEQSRMKENIDTGIMLEYLKNRINKDKDMKQNATLLFQVIEHVQQLRSGGMELIEKEQKELLSSFQMQHYPKLILRPNAKEHQELQTTILTSDNWSNKEWIIRELSDFMLRQVSPLTVLQYLCLFSVLNSGLLPKDFALFKDRFIANYGIKWLPTWFNLRKLGLLTIKESSLMGNAHAAAPMNTNADLMRGNLLHGARAVVSLIESGSYRKLIDKYNLLPCDNPSTIRDKLSRTTGGTYIPLSVKIIEQVLKNIEFDEKTRNLIQGGITVSGVLGKTARKAADAFIENAQKSKHQDKNHSGGQINSHSNNINQEREQTAHSSANRRSSSNSEKIVLLYVLGGITYSEISALRLLGDQLNYKFIFCTDTVLNGDRMLEQFCAR